MPVLGGAGGRWRRHDAHAGGPAAVGSTASNLVIQLPCRARRNMAIKPLAIQFAPRRRAPGWVALLALAVTGAALGASVWSYSIARAELEQVEGAVTEAAARIDRRNAVPAERPTVTIPD